MRKTLFALLASLLVLALSAIEIQARSTRSGPLARIARASDITVDSLPAIRSYRDPSTSLAGRSTVAPERLRLSFRAFQQDFHLHLEPNPHLLHPDGTTVKYYAVNTTTGEDYVASVETLFPGDVAAYHGVVVHPSHTKRRLVEDQAGLYRDIYQDRDTGIVGRASILLHDDGTVSGVPSFEGSFDWFGNVHHVQSARGYAAKRLEADPAVEPRHLASRSVIVHRDSDIQSVQGSSFANLTAGAAAGASETGMVDVVSTPSMGCSSDALDYNSHSRLLLSDDNNDEQSYSVYSFFRMPTPPRFARRDVFGGWNEFFSKRSSNHNLIEATEALPDGFVYHTDFGDYLQPTFARRQATGNDIGNGGNQTSSYEDVIGSTAGCPNSARVVYAGVASDCAYTQRIGSQDDARTEILNNMNSVSNLYRSTFNISIGVVELDVRSSSCPSSPTQEAPWNIGCGSYTIDTRLSEFSQWRAQQPSNGVGLWHLMTACNSGSEIGVAWLGTVCMTGASGNGDQIVSGTGVSSITTQQWQVMAHEMGHNFGAIHDCTTGCSSNGNYATQNGGAPCCPLSATSCNANANYIMNPSSRSNIENFSQCSIGNVCSLLARGLNTSCIATPGSRATLSTQQCGNGILEPGEECDAGPNGSQCCTTECRLASSAQCDPSTSACCTDSCTFASTSQMCRPALDARCDTAEYCSGTSAECPTDEKKQDGESCGSGLTCANGFCTSRDQQCREASTSSMTFNSACSASTSNSCQLACQSPSSINQCLLLQQTFIDGTSCGYGGRCQDGECKSGSWQATFRNWYRDNLRISVPVTIVVGIIVLLILWAIVRRCCCAPISRRQQRQERQERRASRMMSPPPHMGQARYSGVPAAYNVPPGSHSQFKRTTPNGSERSSDSPTLSTMPNAARSSYRNSRSSNWVDPSVWNGPVNRS
ncbi:hypothetical protein BCV70DRAFT_198508 [Testicularia cyperi]|uniref:Disintegrin and metalloproteinase domain-containing protein B n=1 Tax=Testicularia cyperi TaxID=1882483 RepID=A0A317XVC8_9BASI|nr:hypothetical protein BCV70DRAFT_198508 [Testicularia cyperi]